MEVTQFSKELAELVRGPTRGGNNYPVGVLCDLLQSAIDRKSGIDPESKRKAFLVLISPVPLGAIKRTEIAALQLNGRGFSDVWLYPFGEEPYSLIRG